MAKVKVRVEMARDWEKRIYDMPTLKNALTQEAQSIAGRANAMSAGFRTMRYTSPKTKQKVGDKQPIYKSLPTRMFNGYPVAIVTEGNYAAMKDNHEHNTLVKSIG